jgi:hypothetical protein
MYTYLPKKCFKYVGWSFVSNVFVSIETAISTDSMFHVIGGSEYQTMNYIGKDIIGQTGGLLFMSYFGKKSDLDPKKFLGYSNLIQQSSFFILSSTPLLSPTLFLPVAGASNLLANISFTGYGAVNAKCIQAMSEQNNIGVGELYSKITTVNTFASTIGLAMGVGISSYIPDPTSRTILVPILGMARIYTFNKAVEDLI